VAIPPEGTVLVPIDYDPSDLQIHECSFCSWWWAELVMDPSTGLVLREWHEPVCPISIAWSVSADEVEIPRSRPASEGDHDFDLLL
jgi:hypothetical protein